MAALNAKSAPTIAASPRLSSRIWIRIVASSIQGIGPQNFCNKARIGCGRRSGISLAPYCSRRCCASALVNPTGASGVDAGCLALIHAVCRGVFNRRNSVADLSVRPRSPRGDSGSIDLNRGILRNRPKITKAGVGISAWTRAKPTGNGWAALRATRLLVEVQQIGPESTAISASRDAHRRCARPPKDGAIRARRVR